MRAHARTHTLTHALMHAHTRILVLAEEAAAAAAAATAAAAADDPSCDSCDDHKNTHSDSEESNLGPALCRPRYGPGGKCYSPGGTTFRPTTKSLELHELQ